jgi:N6-adenosine-specific RNA methylase IME4
MNLKPLSDAAIHSNEFSITSVLASERYWVAQIRLALGRSVQGTLQVGSTLIAAKAALPHGAWLPVLAKANLKPRVAQKWMKLAGNLRFANANNWSLLPPSREALSMISRLPDADYQRMLANGTIHPGVTAREIKGVLRNVQRAADEERVRNLAPIAGKFRTLIIDPPWHSEGGRDCPYAVMTQKELLDLPIPEWMAEEAHVYLWASECQLRNGNAAALLERWGIRSDKILVWRKTFPNGRLRMSMGGNFRDACEFILFGNRGNLKTRQPGSMPNLFDAPVGDHSEKPERFYDIVRAQSWLPCGELFQRQPRKGFVNLHWSPPQLVGQAA